MNIGPLLAWSHPIFLFVGYHKFYKWLSTYFYWYLDHFVFQLSNNKSHWSLYGSYISIFRYLHGNTWLSSVLNKLWVSLVFARNLVRALSISLFCDAAFSLIASYSVTGCLWVWKQYEIATYIKLSLLIKAQKEDPGLKESWVIYHHTKRFERLGNNQFSILN